MISTMAGMALPLASANSAVIGCGSTVTQNIVLQRDLTCRGDGLIIGADNLTIDLNGHRLRGAATGSGITTAAPGSYPGGLTVVGGVIERFSTGIFLTLYRGTGLQLRGTTIRQTDVAISGRGSDGGIQLLDATLTDNRQYGVLADASPVRVARSTFERNGRALVNIGPGTTVTASRFIGNQQGVYAGHNTLRLTDSTFRRNGAGAVASLSAVVASGNRFIGDKIGLDVVENLYGMDVQRNSFANGGIGMRVIGTLSERAQTVAGNTFTGNRASGLYIEVANAGRRALAVAGNRFELNGRQPGSYVNRGGKALTAGLYANTGRLRGNRAIRNAGYGIEGYGVTDGGGNVARGNGSAVQCLGVTCTG